MTSPKIIFALLGIDEMRHSYDVAIESLGSRMSWFDSIEALLAGSDSVKPSVVLVDLDLLNVPWEPELQKIRSAFGRSELVGFSNADSASTALRCLRCGFSDYLVKPVSPEETAWCLRRLQQRHELLGHLDDPDAEFGRAMTALAGSQSVWLIRLNTLEFLQQTLGSEGALWLTNSGSEVKALCGIPKQVTGAALKKLLPKSLLSRKESAVTRVGEKRSIFLPLKDSGSGIFLWGIPHSVSKQRLIGAKGLVKHAEVCLMNVEKFEEVKQKTFVDDLTGLYNSRYLKFALGKAISLSTTTQKPFSVLFIDVDRFKTINDQFGHLVGSAFLVAIGKTIRNTVRGVDPVFRYGGDEFVVILRDTGSTGAREIGERIRRAVEKRTFSIQSHRIQTTVSVGIAVYPEHTSERDTLLKLADEAMYSVKRDNRNAVHLALPPPDEAEVKELDS